MSYNIRRYIIEKKGRITHTYKKHDEAFEKKDGICYTDDSGNEYTYNDLIIIVRDEENVKKLYDHLDGNALEKVLKSSMFFVNHM